MNLNKWTESQDTNVGLGQNVLIYGYKKYILKRKTQSFRQRFTKWQQDKSNSYIVLTKGKFKVKNTKAKQEKYINGMV